MSASSKDAAARQAQSKSDKSKTLDLLRGKRRKQKNLDIVINGEKVTLVFEAISAVELDKLRAKYPPSKEQQALNMSVNPDRFHPALIAATLIDPEMEEDEVLEIWESDAWSSGELSRLVESASAVCLEGFDVPPNANA